MLPSASIPNVLPIVQTYTTHYARPCQSWFNESLSGLYLYSVPCHTFANMPILCSVCASIIPRNSGQLPFLIPPKRIVNFMLGEKKRLQRYATCTFAFSPVCNFTCMTFRREFSLICYHCGDLRRRFWKSQNSCFSLFQTHNTSFKVKNQSWTWSVEVNNKIEKLKKHFWNTHAFQPVCFPWQKVLGNIELKYAEAECMGPIQSRKRWDKFTKGRGTLHRCTIEWKLKKLFNNLSSTALLEAKSYCIHQFEYSGNVV